MNAAEITDNLGLHSLRQRAWVRFDDLVTLDHLTESAVHPIDLCHFWRWSLRGLGMVEQFAQTRRPQLSHSSTCFNLCNRANVLVPNTYF
jgi:hypothetical protein